MTMGERICVLKDGAIQQVDTPAAVYQHPANAFVAGFIGSPEMNIHPARLEARGDATLLHLGSVSFALPMSKTAKLNSRNGAVQFGLRPEHISAALRPEGDSHALPATLRFLEYMGSEVFVHIDIGGLPLTARVPADQLHGLADKPRGAAHDFHLQLGCSHLFDAESGVNLLC